MGFLISQRKKLSEVWNKIKYTIIYFFICISDNCIIILNGIPMIKEWDFASEKSHLVPLFIPYFFCAEN